MQFNYITERPYRGLTEDQVYENGAFFGLPNTAFDAQQASNDYNAYLDEAVLAEEVGFDGVGLNEHHGNPFCMGSVLNIEAAVLARLTERVKIVLIGNPIPASRNPLRLAEELAMIDLISKGRLVTGWVRGSGPEQFSNNANPAFNREMFEEGHDIIKQAWTRPGPWRYEGKHFHYRMVNPWALPYQKPIPPAIIPGFLSRETVEWAVRKGYPYLGLGGPLGPSADLNDIYADMYAERGLQAGPENFGHNVFVYVDETSERAQEIGRAGFTFGGGNASFAKAQHTLPAGYNSPAAIKRLANVPQSGWLGVTKETLEEEHTDVKKASFAEQRRRAEANFERMQDNLQMIIGTPEEVTAKLKIVLRSLRPGMLFMMGPFGNVSDEDRRRSIRLIGEKVLPELRPEAERLGLTDMFQRAPGSVPLAPGQQRAPIVDRAAIAEYDATAMIA
jgi:alkanesulfonate monooxygenase SsuD/methylene tetrahydromethanopterin reductase-like flavin-dependent oxidoreductase (luciferase family)